MRLPVSAGWLTQWLAQTCEASILINMVLCVFNLLPLPPLDGGRVAVGLLPGRASYALSRLEPYGFLIIVVLLMSGMLQGIIGPLVMGSSRLLIGWALSG